MTDGQLMACLQAGDRRAFGVLYDRYYYRCEAVVRMVCAREERVEEALQEGFLSVWRSRGAYREAAGTVSGWLMTIVRRRAIDVVRQSRTRESTLTRCAASARSLQPASQSLEDGQIAREQADELGMMLRCLPPPQAEVIVLAYYVGLTHAEIAGCLGVPSGTVKSRIRLGLTRMRTELGEPVDAAPRERNPQTM